MPGHQGKATKAAEDSRTPRPCGRRVVQSIAIASWSAAVFCRFFLIDIEMRRLFFCFLMIQVSLCLSHSATTTEQKHLLVIAPRAFCPTLDRFTTYKQKLLPTELKSLEDILSTTSGVDDPEKLKRFLYNEWKSHNLGYALLVGDVDVMPVRFMVLDRVTPAAFDYAFYPSDLYYSDLAKADGSFEDWNAQKDSFHAGYFGEVRGEKNKQDLINYDGIDYLPDIAVGRW